MITENTAITRYFECEDGEYIEKDPSCLFGEIEVRRGHLDMDRINRIIKENPPENFPDRCDHCNHIIDNCYTCDSAIPRKCLNCGKEII